MKKALLISGIIFGLLLIILIAIPFFYKDKIVELVKREANKNLEATLDFRAIGLNLFENFPNFTLNIDDLTLVNKAPFTGDTLLALANFQTTLDLRSIISGDAVKIVAIRLDRPDIRLHALKVGSENWDITKKTEETAPTKARGLVCRILPGRNFSRRKSCSKILSGRRFGSRRRNWSN